GQAHPLSPAYVPDLKELDEYVPVYVPEPEHPEYHTASDDDIQEEDTDEDSISYSDEPEDGEEDDNKDPKEDPSEEDEPEDDDTYDEDEEPTEDEEEEYPDLTDSSVLPVADPVPSAGDIEAFETDESAPTPRSPQTKVLFSQTHLRRARKTIRLDPPMSPSIESHIAEYATTPTPPSPLSPWLSPLPQIPSPPLLPPPPSLHLPPPLPTSLPLPSSLLPPLLALLFIPPPVDRREDIPKAELPPRKRLCPAAPTLRYEVGESSTATPRPIGGHRADYGFINTIDAEIRRQRAKEVSYGIRDVWVDPSEAIEEVAPTTLEGVNDKDRQTQIYQRVDILAEDRQFHYETEQLSATLGQISALQARDQTHVDNREGAGSSV
ncbi:hypothetical protein Tco_1458674, partial [Tanacetum coccineum]